MFFDEGNCRTVRLLREASHFLEACIEKLLVLEQEALSELRNESNSNKNEGNNSSTEQPYVNEDVHLIPSTSSAYSDINEGTSLCDTEHKFLNEPKKISPLDSDNSPPITPETSSKRKYEVSTSSTVFKKTKCDKMIHLSDEEVPKNYIVHEKISSIEDSDQEYNSESVPQNIIKELNSNELVNSSNVISENKNLKNVPGVASKKE